MKDKEFRPLLEENWKKLKASSSTSLDEHDHSEINWNYYISEPFPSIWPPKSNIYLIYYAYAEGFGLSTSLEDGIVVSAPWAKIEYDYIKQKVLNKTILSEKIIPIGSQGIQAMNGKEIGAFDHAISLENYLLMTKEDRSIKHLKDYYCLWIKHHQIIFNKIRPEHKEFTSWLHKKC